ncbi:DUF4007 family protein [Thiohalorhabdus sp. Cl-TMA]|uniref:DUF4007 family protein n=1 Tax=Thiohalorhabdus methylotrophus TaxID=3242694 RepID=A0ABV4TQ89_9GAMM
MRFSGHETFPIREGWLHKGLELLFEDPEGLVGPNAADELGVGQNMAKSIRHWLQVTDLAEFGPKPSGSGPRLMHPTELAELIRERDPYFLEPGSLWALHANLVNGTEAGSWFWFFNFFNLSRFERSACLENLRQFLQLRQVRQASLNTLERDLTCLLHSYAQGIPPRQEDPEEEPHCPFVDLDLLRHYRSSGHYELNRETKPVPFELLGYTLAAAFPDAQEGEGRIDIRLDDAQGNTGGPGRVFVLTPEGLFDTILEAERESGGGEIQISGLAGERAVRITRRTPLEWLARYYDRMEEGTEDAA